MLDLKVVLELKIRKIDVCGDSMLIICVQCYQLKLLIYAIKPLDFKIYLIILLIVCQTSIIMQLNS
jgi:hypothetical protein